MYLEVAVNFTVWVLSLCMSILSAHHETVPWVDDVILAAEAISEGCESRPLGSPSQDGSTRNQLTKDQCASVLVVMAFGESRFHISAIGDHGAAKGLFQVHSVSLGRHVGDDAEDQMQGAMDMLNESFRICAGYPLADRLAFYASGSCSRRQDLSRYRMRAAAAMLRTHPWTPEVAKATE